MSNPRKFSTAYEDHEGLLHKFAKGGYARLLQAGVAIDYEDVFQEMCVSYCRARDKYNPESGIGFGAYLGRAVMNNFNKYADRLLNTHFGLGLVSLDEFEEDNGSSPLDFLEVDSESREAPQAVVVERRSNLKELKRRLSKSSKVMRVVSDYLSPSEEIVEKHKAEYAHHQFARSEGLPSKRVSEDISLSYVANHYGTSVGALVSEIESLGSF